MPLPKELVECVRNRQVLHMPKLLEVQFNLYEFVKYVATHPSVHTPDQTRNVWRDAKQSIHLAECQTRGSTPTFATDHLKEMRDVFQPRNVISLVMFCGMTDQSRSFDIHCDDMDVFYVQVEGEITWQIWEPLDNARSSKLTHENARLVSEQFMEPGDAVWVPRYTYHQVIPHAAPRVGYSFGVEKGPDPSTYV
jgi:hypothetical protein